MRLRKWRVVQYVKVIYSLDSPSQRTEYVLHVLRTWFLRRTAAERVVKLQNEHDCYVNQTLHIKRNVVQIGEWRLMLHDGLEQERASGMVKVRIGREWWR